MWPVRLDVSRVSYPEFVRVVVPFIPGVVLAVGLALAWPNYVREFFAVSFIGYKTKLVVLGIAIYVAGFLLTRSHLALLTSLRKVSDASGDTD
jgi:hypothetical protein